MADISSGCTLKQLGQMGGINVAVIQTAETADDGDTIELDTVLSSRMGTGVYTKKVLFVTAMQDPTGTAANEPMIWSDTTDTITIGGSTDNKRRDIVVLYE